MHYTGFLITDLCIGNQVSAGCNIKHTTGVYTPNLCENYGIITDISIGCEIKSFTIGRIFIEWSGWIE